MKKILVSMAGVFLALFMALTPVFAAEFMVPERGGNGNVTLSTTETHKNIYVAGGTVTVNSTIQGDIYVAGGTVTVDGPVEQDITIAGGTLTLNNTVGGDIRAIGGTITVNSKVSGDVVVLGGSVMLSEKASVGGDVVTCGGSVDINAQVTGSVYTMAGSVFVNNTVGGNVSIRGSKTVVFGSNANVAGSVTVRGATEPQVKDGAKVGTIDFIKQDYGRGAKKGLAALATTGFIIKFLAFFVVAWLFVYLWPSRSKQVVLAVPQNMPANLGIGLLTVIATPIAAILLFITFIGYYAALIVLFSFVVLILVSIVHAAIFMGSWVLKQVTKRDAYQADWQAALLGVVVASILGFIPVVGWIIEAVVVLSVVGVKMRMIGSHMKAEKN